MHYAAAMTEPTAPLPRFLPLFGIALLVRLGTILLGLFLAAGPPHLQPDDAAALELGEQIRSSSAARIEPWFRWDAVWLVNISQNGYAEARNKDGRLGVAFLPAVPMVMAIGSALGLNPYWFVLIAANIAAAAGAAVLAQVATRLTNDRQTGIRAFVLLQFFPSAFFLSAPYNEAFGLLFMMLALAAWLNRRAGWAGVFAALGSLARMTGVAVGVAALVGWLCYDRTRSGLRRAVILAVGSFAGLVLFWCYLGWAVGDPLAGLKSQAAWGRRSLAIENPLYAIESIYDPVLPHWGEAFVVLTFAGLGIRSWLRRGAFWGLLTLLPVAQMMLSGTFLSGHRVILAAIPGFIELADVLRNRMLYWATLAGFGIAQFILLNRYVHWLFAG